jgi:hypothetical protein
MSSTAVKGLAALACGGICFGFGWRAASSEEPPVGDEPESGSENEQGKEAREPPKESGETTEEMDSGRNSEARALTPELTPAEAGPRIEKIVLARGVNRSDTERAPVETGTSFEVDGRRVYVFLEVDNPDEAAGELSVGWLPPGRQREIGTVTVSVKAVKKWRTWAYNKYITKPGLWHAVVHNASGQIIARAPFEMRIATVPPALDAVAQ